MSKIPEEILPNIYLLKIPFERVYTSVFFICEKDELTLYDTATARDDAETYIFPALDEFEKKGVLLKRIVISHCHGDHAGSLRYIAEKYPLVPVFSAKRGGYEFIAKNMNKTAENGEKISSALSLRLFPGHSEDNVAIFDMRTNTLLTADAFQGYGIDVYGVGGDISAMLESLEKALSMNAENLITSHDYFPLGQTAFGKSETEKYLKACKTCIFDLYEQFLKKSRDGMTDIEKIAKEIFEEKRKTDKNFPSVFGKNLMSVVEALTTK